MAFRLSYSGNITSDARLHTALSSDPGSLLSHPGSLLSHPGNLLSAF